MGSPVPEEENEDSWTLLVFFLNERKMSSSDSRRGATGEAEEAAEDPADTTLSARESNLRISHKALELTRESSALCSKLRLVCKGDSKSLSPQLALVTNKRSESNLSSNWTASWLLVKLLSFCCCWLGCSMEEWESGWEEGAVLYLLCKASVSNEGETRLVCSGMDTAGPRLSRLNGMDILEPTERILDLENSPLWGLPPENTVRDYFLKSLTLVHYG